METIVSLRQWQLHMPSTDVDTRLTRWLRKSFREIQSLLPVYFDRVQAFATPLYGFDTAALRQRQGNVAEADENRTDWDVTISDFLRRQEKLGGPPTAVAVVLDAAAASNLHLERGFRFAPAETDSKKTEDARVLWPAVYLRSTLHLASSSLLSSGPSMNVRSSPLNSGVFRSTQTSRIPSWTSAHSGPMGGDSPSARGGRKHSMLLTSSPGLSQRKSAAAVAHHHQSVLEYAPDVGPATSWPHSDWDALVASLDKNESVGKAASVKLSSRGTPCGSVADAVTDSYRYSSDEEETDGNVNEGAALMMNVTLPAPMMAPPPTDAFRKKDGHQSTFHEIALGDWLTLVVMVKDKEEESRWHRRRHRLDDEDIRVFLTNLLAKKLCAANIFSVENLSPLLKKETRESNLNIPCDGASTWASEKQLQDFLGEVKHAFGWRRPASNFLPNDIRSFSFYANMTTPSSPANLRRQSMIRGKRAGRDTTPFAESAAALFLGPDLASAVK